MLGRKALVAADHLVFDGFTVLKAAEAGTLDDREVDEHVFALGADYEAKALLRVEPFDWTAWHGNSPWGSGGHTPKMTACKSTEF
jgi:hypothetical protein